MQPISRVNSLRVSGRLGSSNRIARESSAHSTPKRRAPGRKIVAPASLSIAQ
jgi:hypothetical protein